MAIGSKKNIWVAAGDGNLDRVVELVEEEHISPNAPDENTYTPIHAAASYGHAHVLEYLISRGGNVNISDEDGDTPLYTVENTETARFLVQHGALIDHRNKEGISPIEHLREDFPLIAAWLESSISTAPGSALPSAPSPPSQHSQNAASERLTDRLLERMESVTGDADGEVEEEELRRIVTRTVLEGIAQGYQLQQASEGGGGVETSEKRARVE